jgi:hypothetical protein
MYAKCVHEKAWINDPGFFIPVDRLQNLSTKNLHRAAPALGGSFSGAVVSLKEKLQ